MLLKGINHVAILTNNTDRLHAFYKEMFDATIFADREEQPGVRLSFIAVGDYVQLNVFEITDNAEADKQVPMFGRGRIDHMGLEAADQEAFDEIRRRLMKAGATDGFVTDFGAAISVFFRDPDGLEGEVLLHNPKATAADLKGPGNPAAGYDQ
jgi:catechol 2,3-dioxygenase-like lactoylglutathione lyase family enzyme